MRQYTSNHWPSATIALFALAMSLFSSAKAQRPMADQVKGLHTGFETLTPGPLANQNDNSGRWTADADHAVVHTSHHRTGMASLRLLGGTDREVVWTPNSIRGKADRLEFWFERWTARDPFKFQVDLRIGDQWKSAYSDSGKAQVGGFKNHVSIPLAGELPSKVRFRSTTPSGSGVMIDDLSMEENAPKRIVSVTCKQRIVPLLVRNKWNPAFDLTFRVQGNEGSLTLDEVTIALNGSLALNTIESVDVIASKSPHTAWYNVIDLAKHDGVLLFGSSMEPSARMAFHGTATLDQGDNHFLVSVQLKDSADVSQSLQIGCPAVTVSGTRYEPTTSANTSNLRIGHALRRAGDDGVNTYRIPGLATTTVGTLIAVYDVRHRNGADLPGDIDVGMSRSVDGGLSWEPMRIIMDMGNEPEWKFDGIGDPAVLVDTKLGTIWVAALWSHGDRSWHRSGQGTSPEQTGQFILVRSDDDGKSWSEPINITEQIKRPEWNLLFNGPGKGICMEDGTLVFAAQYQDEKRVPHSTIVYSQDHGKTWHVGTGAHRETTEAQVVEVRPGELMLNCRYNNSPTRVVMTTKDLGATWQEHLSSKKLLIEPAACMGSLIDVDQELGEARGGWLLFSNPDSQSARERITIKASSDGGNSWPQANRLILDEGRSAGYSCMTMIDRDTVGILYEGSTSKLVFQRIPIHEIISVQPDDRPINVSIKSSPSSTSQPTAPNQDRTLSTQRLSGLVAATYTPFNPDGSLALSGIGPMVEHLIASGNRGLYVCGSTGEGVSLTTTERCDVAEAYVQAADGRVPVFVQVGHNSIEEAKLLAAHAQRIGADAVSATCPSYFKMSDQDSLLRTIKAIASAAPSLPFYYYHIPALTGSSIDIVSFMQAAGEAIPNLYGLKYTDTKLHEFQQCLEVSDGRYDVVWGTDEMMLGALATGAKAAIGSTYNVIATTYLKLWEAFDSHQLEEAQQLQLEAIRLIRVLGRYPFHSAMKELLRLQGHDFGSCRLPQRALTSLETAELQQTLQSLQCLPGLGNCADRDHS